MWEDNGTKGSPAQWEFSEVREANETRTAREQMEERLAKKNKIRGKSIYRFLLGR